MCVVMLPYTWCGLLCCNLAVATLQLAQYATGWEVFFVPVVIRGIVYFCVRGSTSPLHLERSVH